MYAPSYAHIVFAPGATEQHRKQSDMMAFHSSLSLLFS